MKLINLLELNCKQYILIDLALFFQYRDIIFFGDSCFDWIPYIKTCFVLALNFQ